MNEFPKGIQRSIVFIAGVFAMNVAVAIAPVESRGEPFVEVEPYSSSSSRSVVQPANSRSHGSIRTEDRTLQMLNQIESLKQELNDLRGMVEVQEHEIKQAKKSQQDLYLDLEKRITQLQTSKGNRVAEAPIVPMVNKTKGIQISPKKENHTKLNNQNKSNVTVDEDVSLDDVPTDAKAVNSSTSKLASTPTVKKAASEVVKITPRSVTSVTPGTEPGPFQTHTEKEAFDIAYRLVSSKQYDHAITALEDFIVQYPRGNYAPNAHYWLGEIHMVKWQNDKSNVEMLDNASRCFNTVSKDFPGASKVSDSLLKLGIIAVEKGDSGAARRYFTDVKMQYPNSAAARIAETKLQQVQ